MLIESKIAGFLEILSDGKWHWIEELQQQMGMDVNEVQEIAMFLNKYDFAMVNDENKKVKINRDFQKFLARIMI
jgi:6-pyruvoyl-tetrahydropterin synthase